MPKTWKRRRFRKTPYAYSDIHLAQLRARYHNRSTVTSKDVENSCNHKSTDTLATASLLRYVALTNDAITLSSDKLTDGNPPESPNDSQSSLSHHSSSIDQASSAQASLDRVSSGQTSSTGTVVNNDPAPSSVTTRQATGTEYSYYECKYNATFVPELLLIEGDAIVPSVDKPSVTKEKQVRQNEVCGLQCSNDCHKKLTVGISYFINICEECVPNIEHACSRCQSAYKTKQLANKT